MPIHWLNYIKALYSNKASIRKQYHGDNDARSGLSRSGFVCTLECDLDAVKRVLAFPYIELCHFVHRHKTLDGSIYFVYTLIEE